MKRAKIDEQESYSEGNMDEGTIAYFLRNLENFDAPKKVKHKMKVVLVELISNILEHANAGFGSVSVKRENNGFIIKTSNYAAPEKISRTIALASEIKGKSNLREHYLSQLAEVSDEKKVSLGLVEVFRLSDGNTSITSGVVAGKPVIHFEIRLNDGEEKTEAQ